MSATRRLRSVPQSTPGQVVAFLTELLHLVGQRIYKWFGFSCFCLETAMYTVSLDVV